MTSKEWTKYGVNMSMTWNSENRMTDSISQNVYSGAKTLTRYKYDHEGNRVVKSSNYGEVVTPTPEISYRNDSIVTKHIFVSGVRVASKVCDDKSSNTYYQSVDHLGSTNVLTDDKGEFYEHIETFPDGNIWVKEYVDQSGVNAVFTCHEMDVETKFFYAKARYYDAQLGRFISVDPIIGEYLTGKINHGVYLSIHLNLYQYSVNNPIKYKDPSGLYEESSKASKKLSKKYDSVEKCNINIDRHDPDKRRDVYIYYNKNDKADTTHIRRRKIQAFALGKRDQMKTDRNINKGNRKYTGKDGMADVADYAAKLNNNEYKNTVDDLAYVMAGVEMQKGTLRPRQVFNFEYYIGNSFGADGLNRKFYSKASENQQRHFFGYLHASYSVGWGFQFHPQFFNDTPEDKALALEGAIGVMLGSPSNIGEFIRRGL